MLNTLFTIFDKKLLIVNNEDPHQSIKVAKKLEELKGRIIIKTDSNINEILPFRMEGLAKSPIKCNTAAFVLPVIDVPQHFKNRHFQDQLDRFESQIRQF